ncbi:uncharacterized protein LY89DRAFT_687918 [Mollisia scopiformis]|uniref:Uncharacterized protein n=1 Tax=Mollisia scopiformis TaxID=149040 RepID=A0A194WZJ9_MOLSC|nr:uncharacterized protein LY89DRAFT_687918 [Mollisia scopiformis]KUJ13032.1 hypothetical protein LY89DRAFT_687918 [Mollisia scopiformis]
MLGVFLDLRSCYLPWSTSFLRNLPRGLLSHFRFALAFLRDLRFWLRHIFQSWGIW